MLEKLTGHMLQLLVAALKALADNQTAKHDEYRHNHQQQASTHSWNKVEVHRLYPSPGIT